MNVVRLSALSTGRIYSPWNIPGIYFCWRLRAGRMSMKNSIGNRSRDLPTCSAVPRPTALKVQTQNSKYLYEMVTVRQSKWYVNCNKPIVVRLLREIGLVSAEIKKNTPYRKSNTTFTYRIHSSLFLSWSPQLQIQVDQEPLNNQQNWAWGSAITSTILQDAVGQFLSHLMGLINDHFKWICWLGIVLLRPTIDFLSQG
jgi:hypothetical protein